jgi:hypothetical protein
VAYVSPVPLLADGRPTVTAHSDKQYRVARRMRRSPGRPELDVARTYHAHREWRARDPLQTFGKHVVRKTPRPLSSSTWPFGAPLVAPMLHTMLGVGRAWVCWSQHCDCARDGAGPVTWLLCQTGEHQMA